MKATRPSTDLCSHDAGSEVLKMLADAGMDVREGHTAPAQQSFDSVRASLQKRLQIPDDRDILVVG